MKKLSIAVLAVAGLSALAAPIAEAGRYYTRETVRQCRSDAGDTIVGGLIGGAVGCGLGALIGGNSRGCAKGAAIGGGVGLAAGFFGSMECRDRVVYVENVERYFDEGRFERRSNWGRGETEVIKTIYRNDGSVCHVHNTYTRNGTYKQISCRSGRTWQHTEWDDGYERTIIRESRSYGSYRSGVYVEEYSYSSRPRGGSSVVIEERYTSGSRGARCVAYNGRGIPFRATGFDLIDAERNALRSCRNSYETYNPRSCRVADCRR